ncbi:MAG: winged helix-turn-helix transcriptional regulator [Thermoplasmatota archaeon]
MRATPVGFLILAISVVGWPVAEAQAMAWAEFATPAQAQGALQVGGSQWAVILFHDAHETSFDVALPKDSLQTNQTIWTEKQRSADPAGSQVNVPLAPEETSIGPVAASFRFDSHSWASVLVVADSIAVQGNATWGALGRIEPGESIEHQLPDVVRPNDATSLSTHPSFIASEPGVAVGFEGDREGAYFAFDLKVEGLQHIEWHNATVSCSSAACPDPGAPFSQSVEVGGIATWVQRLSYIHLQTSSGRLHGGGEAYAIAVGGGTVDLGVAGRLRLPGAALAGDCPEGPCPNPAGRTFQADGALLLSRLAPQPDSANRLQAELSGDIVSAAFDESPSLAFTPPGVAVAGAALLGLAWLLKVLWGLFSRTHRPPALQHPRRQELYALIQGEPGSSFRHLQRRLEWASGTLTFHVNRLVDDGHVVTQPYRNTVRFFENHGKYGSEARKATAALKDPSLGQLHDWLLRFPHACQAQIVQATASWGWSRPTTRRRLRNLQDAGLLDSQRLGRRVEYTAKPFLPA